MARVRVFVRYYCEDCGGHVTPYSKFERRTLAPQGMSNGAILLTSFNNTLEKKIGWCFSCRAWMALNRLTEHEILQKYIARRGVHFRKRSSKKSA